MLDLWACAKEKVTCKLDQNCKFCSCCWSRAENRGKRWARLVSRVSDGSNSCACCQSAGWGPTCAGTGQASNANHAAQTRLDLRVRVCPSPSAPLLAILDTDIHQDLIAHSSRVSIESTWHDHQAQHGIAHDNFAAQHTRSAFYPTPRPHANDDHPHLPSTFGLFSIDTHDTQRCFFSRCRCCSSVTDMLLPTSSASIAIET